MQGLFLKPSLPSYPNCSATPPNTHTCPHTPLVCKGQQMQMTQFTSTSLPGNPPPVLSLTPPLWGVYSSIQPPVESPGHLTHNPLPCWHKLGHEQSIMGTCSAWWPECAHFCSQTHCLPFCTPSGSERTIALLRPRAAQWWKSNTCSPPSPSKDRKEAIMFKHPHYEPQVSHCGSLSIKGFNRWRRRGRVDSEGQYEGEQREDWRLFFFSIDLSPDSHWLLLNKGPWEEVG